MTTKCQGSHGAEHDPIEFEGDFTALCPLCAALRSVAVKQAEVDKAEHEAFDLKDDLTRAEDDEEEAKRELENVKEIADKTIDELSAKIKELEARL